MFDIVLIALNTAMVLRLKKCGESGALGYVLGTWLPIVGGALLGGFIGAGMNSEGVILFLSILGYGIGTVVAIQGLRNASQLMKNYEAYQQRLVMAREKDER